MNNKIRISDIGDEYNKLLANGEIAKAMTRLFKLDKHHLFTPFKMGFYLAVLLREKETVEARALEYAAFYMKHLPCRHCPIESKCDGKEVNCAIRIKQHFLKEAKGEK